MVTTITLGIMLFFMNRKDNYVVVPVENTLNAIITERFYYGKPEKAEYYEVIYDASNKKSLLYKAKSKEVSILEINNNRVSVWDETLYEGIGVINTEHIEEVRVFDYQSVPLDEIVARHKINDDDIVYELSIEEIYQIYQSFASGGKVLYYYETPKYFQCYIEDEKKVITRMLVIYGQKEYEATLIYGVVDKNKKNISSEFLFNRLIKE